MSWHTETGGISRRRTLQLGGAIFGGLAVGSVPVSAGSSGRYLIKPKGRGGGRLRHVTVEEELPGLDVMAVSGSKHEVSKVASTMAPDPILELDEPIGDAPVTVADADATDEPLYPFQWDKQDLQVADAHEQTRGEGVRVAVIDSGVAAGHPDLPNVNLDLSENFSGDGLGVGAPYGGYHGTHVAGIIGADDQNDGGVVGTAPGAELVDCRVFAFDASAPFSVILAALNHSVEVDADIANLSLGAYAPRQDYVAEGGFGRLYGRQLNKALTNASKEGTLVVMSAGNNSADLQHDGQWISLPNEGAKGVSVSATGPIGFNWGGSGLEAPPHSPAFYTNYGTNAVDIAAPGGDADLETDDPNYFYDLVLSTIAEFARDANDNITGGPSFGWGWAAGTSMAAPNVAGAAALVKANNPGYNANQLESALRRAASVPAGYDKTYYGAGYLNILDAL